MEDESIAAPLLRLIVRRTPKGYGGSTSYGNEYDFSHGCPSCGTGARRTSHLLPRRSDLPKSGEVIETGAGEVLVSIELARLFEAERVTGLDLDQVCDQRTGERLPWMHLRSAHDMPPAGGAWTGGEREQPCPVCRRDGYYDSVRRPLQIAYEPRALAPAPDVVHTWECFGRSWLEPPTDQYVPGARIAQPLVLVTPRVRSLLQREKVRLLDFEPVRTG